jgi:hypothetical protein
MQSTLTWGCTALLTHVWTSAVASPWLWKSTGWMPEQLRHMNGSGELMCAE